VRTMGRRRAVAAASRGAAGTAWKALAAVVMDVELNEMKDH